MGAHCWRHQGSSRGDDVGLWHGSVTLSLTNRFTLGSRTSRRGFRCHKHCTQSLAVASVGAATEARVQGCALCSGDVLIVRRDVSRARHAIGPCRAVHQLPADWFRRAHLSSRPGVGPPLTPTVASHSTALNTSTATLSLTTAACFGPPVLSLPSL